MSDLYMIGMKASPNYLNDKNCKVDHVIGVLVIAFLIPIMLINAFSPATGKAFTVALVIPGIPPL